ncbi:MAG: hypothetical protein DI537_14665 [Stutzerimonas stutzeri]|nr:MAG: hypothetical protein DI537_14665 [Stutzerimonas stutzeri]
MSSHILSFFGLFRRRKSIEAIVSPMKKILADLNAYASHQEVLADRAEREIAAQNANHRVATNEANAAKALASHYQTLIIPKV